MPKFVLGLFMLVWSNLTFAVIVVPYIESSSAIGPGGDCGLPTIPVGTIICLNPNVVTSMFTDSGKTTNPTDGDEVYIWSDLESNNDYDTRSTNPLLTGTYIQDLQNGGAGILLQNEGFEDSGFGPVILDAVSFYVIHNSITVPETSGQRLISFDGPIGNDAGQDGFYVETNAASNRYFRVRSDSDGFDISSNVDQRDQTVLVHGFVDFGAGSVQLRVNGVLMDSTNFTPPATLPNPDFAGVGTEAPLFLSRLRGYLGPVLVINGSDPVSAPDDAIIKNHLYTTYGITGS